MLGASANVRIPTTKTARNRSFIDLLRSLPLRPGCILTLLKPVEPRRIVDQNRLAQSRVGCPNGELVEHAAVIYLVERRDVGGLAVWKDARIRMRPVGAPKDSLRVGLDQRFGQRGNVGIVGRLSGT